MSQSQQMPTSPEPAAADDFPREELSKHRGRWVAFSPDGRRLIGSSSTLSALDAQVLATGADPEEVLLEWIPNGDFIASGLELS